MTNENDVFKEIREKSQAWAREKSQAWAKDGDLRKIRKKADDFIKEFLKDLTKMTHGGVDIATCIALQAAITEVSSKLNYVEVDLNKFLKYSVSKDEIDFDEHLKDYLMNITFPAIKMVKVKGGNRIVGISKDKKEDSDVK